MGSASQAAAIHRKSHFTTTFIVLSTRQLISSLLRLISSKLVSSSLAFDTSHLIISPGSGFGLRWDAIHFVSIGKNGYEFEQQLAFMPGWPVIMRLGAELLAFVRGKLLRLLGMEQKIEVEYSDLVLAGSMINVFAGGGAAMFLYK
jgi:phosphatidylinositol glycan class V